MIIDNFLKNLELDDSDVKALIEAVFVANLIGDDQDEGPQAEIVEGWKLLLTKVLTSASRSEIYKSDDPETILDDELNDSDDLENILATNRHNVFWEELVSHIVGREIESIGIDLKDADASDALYQEIDKAVADKGLDILKD